MTEDISSDFQELESGKTGFERIASPVVVYRSMTPKSRKVRLGITLSGEVYDQIMGKTPRFSVAFSPRNYSLKIEHKEGGKIEVFEPHKGERRVFRVEMPPGIDIDDDVRHACRYDIIAGTLITHEGNIVHAGAKAAAEATQKEGVKA